jgi:hypothetical protein
VQPQLLLLAPSSDRLAAHYHNPLLLRHGPVRAVDVRKRLARAGIDAAIVEGGLVTKGGIVIRKGGSVAVAPSATTAAAPTAAPALASTATFDALVSASAAASKTGPAAAGNPVSTALEAALQFWDPSQPHALQLEGPICAEYYAVRAALYELYTHV